METEKRCEFLTAWPYKTWKNVAAAQKPRFLVFSFTFMVRLVALINISSRSLGQLEHTKFFEDAKNFFVNLSRDDTSRNLVGTAEQHWQADVDESGKWEESRKFVEWEDEGTKPRQGLHAAGAAQQDWLLEEKRALKSCTGNIANAHWYGSWWRFIRPQGSNDCMSCVRGLSLFVFHKPSGGPGHGECKDSLTVASNQSSGVPAPVLDRPDIEGPCSQKTYTASKRAWSPVMSSDNGCGRMAPLTGEFLTILFVYTSGSLCMFFLFCFKIKSWRIQKEKKRKRKKRSSR